MTVSNKKKKEKKYVQNNTRKYLQVFGEILSSDTKDSQPWLRNLTPGGAFKILTPSPHSEPIKPEPLEMGPGHQ